MRNNRVSDVIGVLEFIRDEQKKYYYHNIAELRKDAIKQFAEAEFQTKRYLNLQSAERTIHDACTRRLKLNTSGFDELADEWRRNNSMKLKDILLRQATNIYQRIEVENFFASREC